METTNGIEPSVQYIDAANDGNLPGESNYETGAGSSREYMEGADTAGESEGPDNENENDLQDNEGETEFDGDLREIRTGDDLDEPDLDSYIPDEKSEESNR